MRKTLQDFSTSYFSSSSGPGGSLVSPDQRFIVVVQALREYLWVTAIPDDGSEQSELLEAFFEDQQEDMILEGDAVRVTLLQEWQLFLYDYRQDFCRSFSGGHTIHKLHHVPVFHEVKQSWHRQSGSVLAEFLQTLMLEAIATDLSGPPTERSATYPSKDPVCFEGEEIKMVDYPVDPVDPVEPLTPVLLMIRPLVAVL